MVAYTRAKIEHLLKIDFVRFCIVGGTGFIINFILLVGLRHFLHLPTFIAQAIGAEVALFSNFMLHHHWTYKSHNVQKSIPRLMLQFHATSWPAILGSALMVSVAEKLLHFDNLTALSLSSVIALAWNFTWSKFIIWRHITSQEIEEIAR